MKKEDSSLFFEKSIKAPAKEVYRAFTNEATLMDWLCNVASVDVNLKTRLYLWWTTGYYTYGEFTRVVPQKEIIFTWLGKNDPGKTRVRVTFKQEATFTHLTLEHRGVKDTPRWAAARQQIQKGWETSLENLVSIMETGHDLRLLNLPMIGIYMDEFDPEIAAHLKIPVSQGVRLSGVIDGLGAQHSGLMKDDVLVEGDGVPIENHSSLKAIINGRKAGESIKFDFYRGAERMSAPITLAPRIGMDVPASCTELVQVIEDLYAQSDRALEEALEGVSEEEAAFRPGAEEWNCLEVLAHLIHVERDTHISISKWITNEKYDGPANLHARLEATLSVYPTLRALRAELGRCEAETLAFLRNLPEDFLNRKDSYWLMATNLLQVNFHPMDHVRQIQANLAAVRRT